MTFEEFLKSMASHAAIADNPAVMTASGFRVDDKGNLVLDQVDNPGVKQLRDNLAVIGLSGLTPIVAEGAIGAASKWVPKAWQMVKEWAPKLTFQSAYPNAAWAPYADAMWYSAPAGASIADAMNNGVNLVNGSSIVFNTMPLASGAIKTISEVVPAFKLFKSLHPRYQQMFHGSPKGIKARPNATPANAGISVTPNREVAEQFGNVETVFTPKPKVLVGDMGNNGVWFGSKNFYVGPENWNGMYTSAEDVNRLQTLRNAGSQFEVLPNETLSFKNDVYVNFRDAYFPNLSNVAKIKLDKLEKMAQMILYDKNGMISKESEPLAIKLNDLFRNIMVSEGINSVWHVNPIEGGTANIIFNTKTIKTKSDVDMLINYYRNYANGVYNNSMGAANFTNLFNPKRSKYYNGGRLIKKYEDGGSTDTFLYLLTRYNGSDEVILAINHNDEGFKPFPFVTAKAFTKYKDSPTYIKILNQAFVDYYDKVKQDQLQAIPLTGKIVKVKLNLPKSQQGGTYNVDSGIFNAIITAAKNVGIDPKIGLAIAIKESSLGAAKDRKNVIYAGLINSKLWSYTEDITAQGPSALVSDWLYYTDSPYINMLAGYNNAVYKKGPNKGKSWLSKDVENDATYWYGKKLAALTKYNTLHQNILEHMFSLPLNRINPNETGYADTIKLYAKNISW